MQRVDDLTGVGEQKDKVGGPIVAVAYIWLGRALVGRRKIQPRTYRYAGG